MKVLVAQSCLTVIPWAVAHQAPLSMGISRKEYWSGLPCPPPGHLPNPGIEPRSSEYRLILYHLPDSQGVPCVFVSTFRIKIPREEIILVYMECTHPRHKRDGGTSISCSFQHSSTTQWTFLQIGNILDARQPKI